MDYSFYNGMETLTFQSLLNSIDQETVYSSYIGRPIDENTKFRSIFRANDTVPSMSFYATKQGMVLYKDFGKNDRAGNVFSFVQKLYKLNNLWEAVVQINHDFKVGLLNCSSVTPKPSMKFDIIEGQHKISTSNKVLSFKERRFMERDKFYWDKFNVDKTILDFFHVKVADIVYINALPIWFYEIINPIYAYVFGKEQYKFYRPLNRKDGKFLSSRKIGNIYAGYEQLPRNGKELIITKALKDVMTLYSLGIPAIAPNGENYTLSPDLIQELQIRFDDVYLLLDNDFHKPINENTGINAMKNIVKMYENIYPIIIPDQLQCTDIAEVMENYDIRFTKNFIKDAKRIDFKSWR